MSLFLCPTCRRSFDEVGFCPFDRAQLIAQASPEAQTLLSAAMPAQAGHKTDIDPKRTYPLGSQGPATDELTSARPRPVSQPVEVPKIRALSASEDPIAALAAYNESRENEYDKLVGQTLDGRYFIERKIGEGGMGVVFSARHAVIERPLAIKVLKREVMRDTATIRRFVQEAKAASRIGHPNIVDVTDFGTTPDGMTYSVMEYVLGQTLGTALREAAPFPIERTIRIAAQIARALGAAHDKGIVHRDLKPENVFLSDRDNRKDFVKIVDFGIAKVAPLPGAQNPNEPRLTRAGSVFGTPEYMAPEQAAGRSDTDGRVDIYALGILMYEMITGRVPHRGDSTVRTLAMQMLDPIEPPSKVRPDLQISGEVEAVVLRTLAKKREARFQTMGDLLAALDGLQTHVGTSVTGSPVYALMPLPPGADGYSGGTLDMPTPLPLVPTPVPRSTEPESARSRAPTNQPPLGRRLHEPQFVTQDKPATFEHVFTEETPLPARRGWPILLFLALLAGVAIGGIALLAKSMNRATTESRDAAVVITPPPPADASFVAPEPDATVIAEIRDAATDIVIVDAGRIVGPPGRPRDAGAVAVLPVTPNGRGTINIQVITKPEGAQLYVGYSYRGPGGANLEEPFGTKVDVQCRLRGYKPGNVSLVFDGKTEYVLCVLERIKICVNGLKNPFDDCEPAPPPTP